MKERERKKVRGAMMCKCRKRPRGWVDESSASSSDADESDGENEEQRGDQRSEGSDESEGGGSEGEDDVVDLDEPGDGDDQSSGSESIVSSTDEHYGSQELIEIHDHDDTAWMHE